VWFGGFVEQKEAALSISIIIAEQLHQLEASNQE
jgi:hypothetical protein